jgi:hypothetical protein
MIDVEKVLAADGSVDRDLLHLEIVRYMTTGMGYNLSEDRLQRIAKDSRAFMDAGYPFVIAYTEALEVELLLYGDPKAPEQHFMPILIEKV